MKVVTTFAEEHWEEYVQRCVSSWLSCLPCEIVVYADFKCRFPQKIVDWKDLSLIAGRREFMEKCDPHPRSYLFDAKRFCHKAFAQMAAIEEYSRHPQQDDELFWIDADVFFFKPVDEYFLKGLLKDVAICYLGRDTYSETGFVGFNLRHRDIRGRFLPRYQHLYRGDLLKLPFHTDCHAFDEARKGCSARDIGGGRGIEHVWCNSPLAEFSDHWKGPLRKKVKHSPEHPYAKIYRSHQARREAEA